MEVYEIDVIESGQDNSLIGAGILAFMNIPMVKQFNSNSSESIKVEEETELLDLDLVFLKRS